MTTLKRYLKSFTDYLYKGEVGDVGYFETTLYGLGLRPEVATQLKTVSPYVMPDLDQLKQLPQGTLGYEYAQYMDRYGLQVAKISDDLLEEAKQQPFALRYILIHDLFHTLLGFDTSYAGELGVQGFITGQNYSRALHLTGPLVQLITMLIRPLQARAISRNFRQGKALGQQAHCVLTFPFEQNWARPIQAIRKELNLPQVSHSLSSQPAVPSLKTVGWKGEASA